MASCQRPDELPVGQDVMILRQEDYFLSLAALAKVAGLSVKTLRSYLTDPTHRLPHFRPHGKVLVRWSEFVAWMEQFRVQSEVDVERVVEEVINGLQAQRVHNTRVKGKRSSTRK